MFYVIYIACIYTLFYFLFNMILIDFLKLWVEMGRGGLSL